MKFQVRFEILNKILRGDSKILIRFSDFKRRFRDSNKDSKFLVILEVSVQLYNDEIRIDGSYIAIPMANLFRR